MKYLITFENGEEIISNDNSYVTLITFYKMLGSNIISCIPIF